MTITELNQLEDNLGITLPEEYKIIALDNPFAGSHSGIYELCDEFEPLLGENRYARDHGFFRQSWPPSWFIIGTDGCGNDYFITTTPFDGRVYFANHEDRLHTEDVSENRFHASLEEFMAMLRRNEREIAADEKLVTKRYRNRKWWQFWIPGA